MLTKRDKLLIQPWQQRKYENHLRKVQSALPAIDNHPPATRNHVAVKLKRQQSENERCTRIEKDNLILLQKLNYIMRTNRVDNYWSTPQPNFLNRVALYTSVTPKDQAINNEKSEDNIQKILSIRKAKCLACMPKKSPEPLTPEERVPWEPEKPPVGRVRSKSVPARPVTLPIVKEASNTSSATSEKKQQNLQKKRSKSCKIQNKDGANENTNIKSPQSIILSRGSLVLSVNFPSDTFVKFHEGTSEKLLMRGLCHCKNVGSKIY